MKNNKQKKGLKRNTIDKFYTKLEIVELCMAYIRNHIDIKENDLIIEPSAGNGSFIKEIKKLSNNNLFFDIEPENKEIIQKDYLKFNIKDMEFTNTKLHTKIHIIGNPPFGRQSSTAIQFIKKSCEYANTISFILPRSFKKESMKRYFSYFFHLVFQIDIPKNSFIVNGKEYDVPCIFQIWEKKPYKRIIPEKIEPKKFKFVKKHENPHISIRRVGVNAGKVSIECKDKNIQTHYFIKFIETLNYKNECDGIQDGIHYSIQDGIKYYINKIENLVFEFNNTVGPKSISKQELIEKLNEVL